MRKKEQDMLCKVIERYFDYKKATESDNPIIKLYAERLLEVNMWEMWVLTQGE